VQIAHSQEAVTLAPTTSQTFLQIPLRWQAVLNSNGSQLVTSINGVSTAVVQIWWSKKVVGTRHRAAKREINYPQLQPGAVVGMVNFPPDSPEDYREDCRDQKLPPGFYTLRYAQPERADKEEEDDMGPFRDFVVLTRVEEDRDPEQSLTDRFSPAKNKKSEKHLPALIRLVPPNLAYDQVPSLINDDAGQSVLQTKISVTEPAPKRPLEIPLAIVLITPRKESGGS
jgi:hypothetical protein